MPITNRHITAARDYTSDERAALGDAVPALGRTTFYIYLNERVYWKNVPAAVWNYKLGGCQVLKKWLSYREREVLAAHSLRKKTSISQTWRGG